MPVDLSHRLDASPVEVAPFAQLDLARAHSPPERSRRPGLRKRLVEELGEGEILLVYELGDSAHELGGELAVAGRGGHGVRATSEGARAVERGEERVGELGGSTAGAVASGSCWVGWSEALVQSASAGEVRARQESRNEELMRGRRGRDGLAPASNRQSSVERAGTAATQ